MVNLWVILITIVVTAGLLFPLGEAPILELTGGFAPYALTNILALYLAYKGRIHSSLISYTIVVFLGNSTVIVLLQDLPPHLVLSMIHFILLHGVVLGNAAALLTTVCTVITLGGASLIGHSYETELTQWMALNNIVIILEWKMELISLITTTFSTGFLVVMTLQLQNQTRAKLTSTLTQLQTAKIHLEDRHARAEELVSLGARLSAATTSQEARESVLDSLRNGLRKEDLHLEEMSADIPEGAIQFGVGKDARWLDSTKVEIEGSMAFLKTIADFYDNALARINSNAKLAETSRMEGVGRLAASVAHDFNNLLVPISASNELLPNKENLSEVGVRAIEASIAATAQATALVDKLLTHSRARDSRLQRIDLTQRIQNTEPLLRTFVPGDITFEFILPSEPTYVRMDPVEVEQVVLNLVLNAKDAVNREGLIQVVLTTQPEHVILTIQDDGHGIPEDQRNWVLGAFHSTRTDGTGLGLSTVSRIVNESQGTIHIQESSQGGAAISITLPRIHWSPAEGEETSQAQSALTPEASYTILIVDDEPLVGESIAELTSSLGHKAILVNSAARAIEMLTEDPSIDLILSDYQMEGANGVEMLQQLRALHDDRPLAIISGYGSTSITKEEHLPCGTIGKPVSREALDQFVRKVMDQQS